MLCSYGPPSAWDLSQDLYWCGLWPDVRPLLHQRNHLLQELHHSLHLMEEPGLQDTCVPLPLSLQHTEGQPFVLRLDTRGFSPEELSVSQGDGVLRVQGRTEKKQQENGRSFHTLQHWTQELSLPEGLQPEELHCYMSPEGALYIQDTPSTQDAEGQTELPISRLQEDRLRMRDTEGHETLDISRTENAPCARLQPQLCAATRGHYSPESAPLCPCRSLEQRPLPPASTPGFHAHSPGTPGVDMPLKKTVAMERRIDLASLFCLIARHGPAVLLTLVGIGCVVAGFVIFRNMREKRRRRRAGEADRLDTSAGYGDAAVGLGEKEEPEGIRRGSTDASDDSSPDVKEHAYLSQVRQRRTASERKSYKHNQPDRDATIDKPQHTFFWEWNSHRTQSYAEEAVQKSNAQKPAEDETQEVQGARETELMKEAGSEEEERMPEADSSEDITTTNEDVSEEEFRQEETVQFTFNSQPCSYPTPDLSVDDSKENTKETNFKHLESEFENAPVLVKEELPSAPYKEVKDYIGDQTNGTNEQSSGINNEKQADKPCNDEAISTSIEVKEGLLLAASQNHEPSKIDQTKDVNFKPSDTTDITDFSLNSQQSELPASAISDTEIDQSGRCPQEQSHHRSEVQTDKDLSTSQKDTEMVNDDQAFPDTIPSERIDALLADAITESLDINVAEDESAVNQDTSKIAETAILSESLQDKQCQEIASQVMDGNHDNNDSLIYQKDMTEEQQIQPICKETDLNVDQIEVKSSSVSFKQECLPRSPNQLTELLDKDTSSSTLSADVKTGIPSITDTTEPSNDLKEHGINTNLDSETTIPDSGLDNESTQADQSASTDTIEISNAMISDKIECIVEQIVADAYKEVRQTSLEPKSAQMEEKTVEQPPLVQQSQHRVSMDNKTMASNAIEKDSGKVFKEEGKEVTFCSNMAAQITEEVVNTVCSLELSNRKKVTSESQKDIATSNASDGISQINIDSNEMPTVKTDFHVQEMNQEETIEQETLNNIENEAPIPLGDTNMEGEVLTGIKAETVESLEKSQQKTLAEINNGLSNTASEVENVLLTKEENQPENTPVIKMEILENSETSDGVQSDQKESGIPVDANKHVSNLTEKKVVIVCRTVEASATAVELSDDEDVDSETHHFEPESSEFSTCQHHLDKMTPANEEASVNVVASCDTLSANTLLEETISQEASKNSDLTSGAALDFSQDNTLKAMEQVMLNDNGVTSPSLESGISSMTVSPEVEEASKEIGKTVEEFEPILSSQDTLTTYKVFHAEERVSHSLLTSDGVVTVMKEDEVTMVIGPLASSPVQPSTPEDISNESLVTNEDSFGSEIEDSYQKAMEEIILQVVDNIKTISNDMTEVVKKVEEMKEQACAVIKEEGEKVDSEKTEISIMEATMDHNEWIIDGSYQVLPWMNATSSRDATSNKEGVVEIKPPAQASTTEDGTENAKKVLAVQPMPQNVNVTFRVHYLPLTPYQTVGVTGDQEELGAWKSIVPLEKIKDGYWSCVVGLPAESHVEWKFVVLDKGEVCRWEECSNRLLYTGYGDDLLVHKWWGFL